MINKKSVLAPLKRGQKLKQETAPEDSSNFNLENLLFNHREQLEPEEKVISIQGKNVGSAGNVVVITGKPKSRKSVVAHAIIGASLSNAPVLGIEANLIDEKNEVILIDTEQSKHDLYRSLERMKRLIELETLPENFKCYSVRKLDPERIKKVIEQICLNGKVKLMIIDGGLDLIMNMNDVIEAKETINFIKQILEKFNVCLVMIIHQSKSTNFTIGHFGSFMDRFAQSNIEVTKLESGNSEIKAQLMRSDANFNSYEFYYNHNIENYSINWVESLEITAKAPEDYETNFHVEKLIKIFGNSPSMGYKSLLIELTKEYQKSEYFSKNLVKYFYSLELIEKNIIGITLKVSSPF
jgi:KaiC/GvpD/RAD55 family RecA-like ATPase